MEIAPFSFMYCPIATKWANHTQDNMFQYILNGNTANVMGCNPCLQCETITQQKHYFILNCWNLIKAIDVNVDWAKQFLRDQSKKPLSSDEKESDPFCVNLGVFFY